jgi:RNA 2',3'-cyclic 3'-phosphodiesterase
MTERWRCFIAVPLNDAIRAALSSSSAQWRAEPPADALRWADPDGWHLTLAFLGSVDSDRVAEIVAMTGEIAASHARTEVSTARLGAFPRPGSARVLWYGVADPDGVLAVIAGALAIDFELPRGEPYRAHITLARARQGHVDLRGWIERASESAPEGRLPVETLHLIRSHLGAGPARYETLASLPLGGHPK